MIVGKGARLHQVQLDAEAIRKPLSGVAGISWFPSEAGSSTTERCDRRLEIRTGGLLTAIERLKSAAKTCWRGEVDPPFLFRVVEQSCGWPG